MKKINCLIIFISLFLFFSCRKEIEKETTQMDKITNPIDIPKVVGVDDVLDAGDGIYDLLGFGYNVTKEYANSNSAGAKVIDLNTFKADYPARLNVGFPNTQEYKEEYGSNAEQYSKKISNTVEITATFPLFKKALSVGFSSSVTSSGKFESKYVWANYDKVIHLKHVWLNADISLLQNYLTPEFISDVNSNLVSPQVLVQRYGTHILLDIYTGGRLNVMFQSETVNSDKEYAARIGVKAGIEGVFGITVNNSVNTTNSYQNFNRKLYYSTRGGNPIYGFNNVINLDQTIQPLDITNWQNSISLSNANLVDFGSNGGMIYLYDLITDPVKKAIVKNYITQYLINNYVYLEYVSIPIYRYFSPYSGDHFYTKSNVTPQYYNFEGVEFNAFAQPVPNTVPIYRFYNPNSGDHFYQTSINVPYGYNFEGIEFYAFNSQINNTVPIHKYYHPSRGVHYYQRVNSGFIPGYVYEGVAFYAF